jgi:hypothetical protein
MLKNLNLPFAAMAHQTEGLCLSALIMLKMENSLLALLAHKH